MTLRLLADLHTHSIASGHAYSTIHELASAAAERGLEAIAVCDHGPSLVDGPDRQHFGNLRVLPPEIDGVLVLTGVESNPADSESGIDLPDRILADLDIVGVGLHQVDGVVREDREINTALLLRAIANPLVDVITHPGRSPFLIDVDRVIQGALQAGVAVELNNHSFGRAHFHKDDTQERAFVASAIDAGLPISISSDAHFSTRVGVLDQALRIADELGLSEDRIVNRDAASVLAFLRARRPRPHLEGEWDG